mgnify:FL=1
MTFSNLDRPVQFLKGVGPKRADALARMGIGTARDLLYHIPRRYDDASTITPISNLEVGVEVTVIGRVRSKGVIPTRTGLRIFQAVLEDDSGIITASWPGQPWLDRKLAKGDVLLASGPVKFFHGRQIQPREFITLSHDEDSEMGGRVFVSYPASEEVPQWVLRRIFESNLKKLLEWVPDDEYMTERERQELGLLKLDEALSLIHRPGNLDDAERGRRRLAFDELFHLQLVQAQARRKATELGPGISHQRSNELIRPLHDALPFELTEAQARVLSEIYADMQMDRRMNRLLQGDVGAGKTIVALFAMLLAAEGGYQSALMAPTEILAEQHFRQVHSVLQPIGVNVVLLTGSLKGQKRDQALEAIESGSGQVIIGTHALIQDSVSFGNLGLLIVDEQHRFGVRQRMELLERKNNRPDLLVMSATPIPRSLAMAFYGDLDLSVLDELPPGRKPVKTELRTPAQRESVYKFVRTQIEKGRQAYLVYPLVSESDKLDLLAATEEFERLKLEAFPGSSLGLLHGQLPASQKEETMSAFARGDLDLLVATTVVEVGIDIPNASVMLIENAERFGLSQLHQLRGRVGRGPAKSHCILIAEPEARASERLNIFRDSTDGFEIARADLRMRGQGDFFGSQQHGRDPVLRFSDLIADEDLLVLAQDTARQIISVDPDLEHMDHKRLSELIESRYQDRLAMFGVG